MNIYLKLGSVSLARVNSCVEGNSTHQHRFFISAASILLRSFPGELELRIGSSTPQQPISHPSISCVSLEK